MRASRERPFFKAGAKRRSIVRWLGLRGMKVEENAVAILAVLGRLRGDFEKIQEHFRILGRHLTNASGSYSETERTMIKLETKLTEIEHSPSGSEITFPPPLPN